jgi:hypothetical protein
MLCPIFFSTQLKDEGKNSSVVGGDESGVKVNNDKC